MYKHYIRLDENNFVIKGYSDAFENYKDGDILIYEGDRYRQFFLLDHICNPNIINDERVPQFKYENNIVRLATDEEKAIYKASLSPI